MKTLCQGDLTNIILNNKKESSLVHYKFSELVGVKESRKGLGKLENATTIRGE